MAANSVIITMFAVVGCCLSVDGAVLNGLAALAATTTTDMSLQVTITLPKAIGNGNLNILVFFFFIDRGFLGVISCVCMQNLLLI
jgi:hypothetical protein